MTVPAPSPDVFPVSTTTLPVSASPSGVSYLSIAMPSSCHVTMSVDV
ncbi:hypothetical protein CMMCAS08_02610 [Clavibacter michiganensis subsp. michiganensis]|nr:hypothetical protein CMMCAS04_14995 [Clavibacter michiganensis subsp. michiganensis]OUD98854.1 hypothetical protein CMMCAS06_11725 [Clavibacter michiganensis subsp. michiganensis]OUE05647.1 hypothetical protein CMMCAS08_02610 [Clavibacter michiganensis subsp. michiganensis]